MEPSNQRPVRIVATLPILPAYPGSWLVFLVLVFIVLVGLKTGQREIEDGKPFAVALLSAFENRFTTASPFLIYSHCLSIFLFSAAFWREHRNDQEVTIQLTYARVWACIALVAVFWVGYMMKIGHAPDPGTFYTPKLGFALRTIQIIEGFVNLLVMMVAGVWIIVSFLRTSRLTGSSDDKIVVVYLISGCLVSLALFFGLSKAYDKEWLIRKWLWGNADPDLFVFTFAALSAYLVLLVYVLYKASGFIDPFELVNIVTNAVKGKSKEPKSEKQDASQDEEETETPASDL